MGNRDLIDQVAKVASWEMVGLASPLFLILLSFVSFFFIPSAALGHELIELRGEADPFSIAAHDLFTDVANAAVGGLYVPLTLIVSFSMMNTLTREFDSGLAKFYLSLPVSRLSVLLGKLLANFLLIYLVAIFACLSYAYLLEPSNFLGYLFRIDGTILVFLCIFFELFFVFGVTTYACMLAPKSWVAVVLCTFSLYSFTVVKELQPQLKWDLPPYVFALYPSFNIFAMVFLAISAILLISSVYLFIRRVEVS